MPTGRFLLLLWQNDRGIAQFNDSSSRSITRRTLMGNSFTTLSVLNSFRLSFNRLHLLLLLSLLLLRRTISLGPRLKWKSSGTDLFFLLPSDTDGSVVSRSEDCTRSPFPRRLDINWTYRWSRGNNGRRRHGRSHLTRSRRTRSRLTRSRRRRLLCSAQLLID